MSRKKKSRDVEFGASYSASADNGNIPVATAVPVDDYTKEAAVSTGISSKNDAMAFKKANTKGKDRTYSSTATSRATTSLKGGGGKGRKGGGKRGGDNPPLVRQLSENSRQTSMKWPTGLCQEVIDSFSRPVNENAGRAFLRKAGWCEGLINILIASTVKHPLRFFIVDDSGSMVTHDGNKIIRTSATQAKMVQTTRWEELTESLKFHAELSEALQAPSEFRLLNGADPCMVGLGNDDKAGLSFVEEVLDEAPAGQTPLCQHITSVVNAIKLMEPTLRKQHKKVAVVIASDGESSDGSVAAALKPLERMPAWVVIRLCTDDEKVVDYWNNIDKQLELEMDVLDDLHQDASQVHTHNGWLSYGDEIHRLREFGASFKEMDLIDEGPLGVDQMHKFLEKVLACKIPNPQIDFSDFLQKTIERNNELPMYFDPITKSFNRIINVPKLQSIYGGGGSTACTIS